MVYELICTLLPASADAATLNHISISAAVQRLVAVEFKKGYRLHPNLIINLKGGFNIYLES